jgi:hypothetical protein
MISIPASTIEYVLMIFLVGCWAVVLFGGFIFGRSSPQKSDRIPISLRLGSSFLLVILAWIIFISAQGTDITALLFWIAVGMSFGLLGDIFMAEFIPVQPHVLFGMGAFGAGHAAYMVGMASIAPRLDATIPDLAVLIFWWIIGIIGWYIAVFRGAKPTVLHYAALPYALLLSSTAAFATSLAFLDMLFIPTAIGATLFLLSDLILAGGLFSGLRFPLMGDIIWLTYGPGQMLIVAGSVLLASLIRTV